MATVETVFVTRIYREDGLGDAALLGDIDAACRSIAEDDEAGQRWCAKNAFPGYTSYASLNDLPWRVPAFKKLVKLIDKHVAQFARVLDLDLGGKKLVCDSIWINVLPPGGVHTSHIHPLSVVSGTFYVAVPQGASALKMEDPRLAMMMAAPPRTKKAKADQKPFIYLKPEPGTLLLWESFLRHEVPLNEADEERISVSFNYAWR